MPEIGSADFWVVALQIVTIDIVLSDDNAVVIALACRGLPPGQRRLAILCGSCSAVLLRVLLAVLAVELLHQPYLKLAGGVALIWIAVRLLLADDKPVGEMADTNQLAGAIKTVVLADLMMSLDNVIAIAAASRGNVAMLIFGLALSIPLIMYSSRLFTMVMERFPILVQFGAGLLGYVAGGMIVMDSSMQGWVVVHDPNATYVGGALGIATVALTGRWMTARNQSACGR